MALLAISGSALHPVLIANRKVHMMYKLSPMILGWGIQYWDKWRNRPHPNWYGVLALEEWGMTEYFIGPFSLIHFYKPRFDPLDKSP